MPSKPLGVFNIRNSGLGGADGQTVQTTAPLFWNLKMLSNNDLRDLIIFIYYLVFTQSLSTIVKKARTKVRFSALTRVLSGYLTWVSENIALAPSMATNNLNLKKIGNFKIYSKIIEANKLKSI